LWKIWYIFPFWYFVPRKIWQPWIHGPPFLKTWTSLFLKSGHCKMAVKVCLHEQKTLCAMSNQKQFHLCVACWHDKSKYPLNYYGCFILMLLLLRLPI
jgi:hypothetical protein